MRRHGIRALAGRRNKPCTTDSRHYLPIAPNLLNQAFVAVAPDCIWLADITYITTGEGWLYLAAVLYLATRKDEPAGEHPGEEGEMHLVVAAVGEVADLADLEADVAVLDATGEPAGG